MSLLPEELYSSITQLYSNGVETVYSAQKRGVDVELAVKHVAIKDLHPTEVMHLLAIHEVILQFDHPHIIRNFGAKHDLARHCVIVDMELCNGGSLAELISEVRNIRRMFSEKFIWSIIGQIASSLAYLHLPFRLVNAPQGSHAVYSGPIIHGNIIPSSILLTDKSVYAQAKLVGLTKIILVQDTETGPAHPRLSMSADAYSRDDVYVAPEVIAGQQPTTKIDVWALGCLLYELCFRKKPSLSAINTTTGNMTLMQSLEDCGYSQSMLNLMCGCLEPDPMKRLSASEIMLIQEISQTMMDMGNDSGLKLHVSNLSNSSMPIGESLTSSGLFKSFISEPSSRILNEAISSGQSQILSDICQHLIKCNERVDSHIVCNSQPGVETSERTLLMLAAESGNIEGVKAHLGEIGKTYNGVTYVTYKNGEKSMKNGVTALMLAAHYNHFACVNMLLPELGIQENSGATALMFAARNGSLESAKLLLAELKYQDNQGKTALFHAALNNNVDIIELIIKKEARITNKEGATALMAAAQNGHTNSVRILSLWEAEMQANKGQTALMLAALNGHADCVDILRTLEAGIKTKLGRFALYNAASNNHSKCVELLLEKEARLQDNNGVSALIIAAQKGYTKCVEILLAREAGLCNFLGGTALMAAASRDNISCVELLSSKEAKMQTRNGITALYMAAFHDSPASVMLLLDYERTMQEENGMTALMAAAKKGSMDCITLLIAAEKMMRDNNNETALMHAAINNRPNSVRALILAEGGLTKEDGTTALMLAAERGHLECILLLIPVEAGMQKNDGITALMLAARNGHYECVKHLKNFEGYLKTAIGKDITEYVRTHSSSKASKRSISACMRLLSKNQTDI